MKSDIHSVYADLNALLNDICEFLSEEVKNGKLSNKASSMATDLIQRSKIQLEEISNIVPDYEPGRYVDMHPTIPNEKLPNDYIAPDMKPESEELPLYSDVDKDEFEPNISVDEINAICPFLTIPAQLVRQSEKSGFIIRREKFLLNIFGTQKKLYVVILGDWMLVYANEKDNKPWETYNLKLYEAKDIENKENSFELVSKLQTKSQFFTAASKQEKLEWMFSINKKPKMTNGTLKGKPNILPLKPKLELIENNEDDNSTLIYEELPNEKEQPKNQKFVISVEESAAIKKPQLPPRNTEGYDRSPLKPKIQSPDIYDCVTAPDANDIYDVIVKKPDTKTNNLSKNYNNDDDMNKIYDVIKPQVFPPPETNSDDDGNDFYDLVSTNTEQKEAYTNAFAPDIKSDLLTKDKNRDKSKLSFSFRSKN